MKDFLNNSSTKDPKQIIKVAREAMHAESDAITAAARRLDDNFARVVVELAAISGKVVVTGLGKSGHIARKIAATLASTGTAAFFLHPTEALHGDLGMLSEGDALLAIAFGGETIEVVEVAKHAKRFGRTVIGITGKQESSLARLADFLLDGTISREVCPLNLAPTASTAVTLALGDALAVALMHVKGFSEVDFATLHPGGTLGRKLSTVQEHMRPFDVELFGIQAEANFHDVLAAVTKRNFGIVPVLAKEALVGAISDGDIRRALLERGAAALQVKAADLMTRSPKTIFANALALEALRDMEKRQITSLFVNSHENPTKLLGIIRMHDLLAAKIV